MSDEQREFAGRLQELFEAALEYDGQERAEFVASACGSDLRLREQLEALLAADSQTQQFLDSSPVAEEHLAEMLDEQPAVIPEQIGRFSVRRVIATGGMGTVYEAQQEHPRRTVALKVMRLSIASRSAQRRFQYESELLAQLQHPGIAQVFEAGTYEDGGSAVPYFAMELVPDAKPITEYAGQHDLKLPERLELFAEVCDAVHHGHQKGIIHRDLKPSNVLVDGAGRPRVIDFGIARSTDADIAVTTLKTEMGQLMGTLQYMSPEQCEADPQRIDTRSDVYALGVVLYELLCGKPPYDVRNLALHEATRMVRQQQPSRLSTIDARLRGDLETIVVKALQKDRDHRYHSAAELADDLRRYLAGEAISARPPSMVYQLRVLVRRNKGLFGAIAAVFAVLVAGVVVSTWMYVRAEKARVETAVERDVAQETLTGILGALEAVDPSTTEYKKVDITVLRKVGDWIDTRKGGKKPLADRPEMEAEVRRAIGRVYASRGHHDDAVPHLRAVREIRRRLYGDEHPKVAKSILELGMSMKWSREGAELFNEARQMYRRCLGDEAPETLTAKHYYAVCLRDGGQTDQAETLLREVLQSRRKVLGDDHLDVAVTLTSLAELLRWDERYAEAESPCRDALKINRHRLGKKHLTVGWSHSGLGTLLYEMEEFEEAEQQLRQGVQILSGLYGTDHTWVLRAQRSLARCLRDGGKLPEAERLLARVAEVFSAAGSEEAYDWAISLRDLGDCHTKMARYAEAEEELLQADGILRAIDPEKTRGVSSEGVERASRWIIEQRVALYEAWDKPDEAARWRAKLPAEAKEQD